MNTEKRNFDKEAASWDENPTRVKLAHDVANAIGENIALTPASDVLDFGCGTGLLTLNLQPRVRSVTGVDSSSGMLDVFKTKIARQNLSNVRVMQIDLDKGDILSGSYQLVVSCMTLHHVKEIKPLLAQICGILTPSGILCIADLDPDDGQFHGADATGVFHPGFDGAELRKEFIHAGFDDVRDMTAAEVIKPISTGDLRRFTVFLMSGRKKTN
ncbi:MAG: class I SAM-dependent methyltransferase [Desulfobacteraceae bacterium]|nr:class I SAM-dependent methyltransferase [Desulfobacteraceae bacterium]